MIWEPTSRPRRLRSVGSAARRRPRARRRRATASTARDRRRWRAGRATVGRAPAMPSFSGKPTAVPPRFSQTRRRRRRFKARRSRRCPRRLALLLRRATLALVRQGLASGPRVRHFRHLRPPAIINNRTATIRNNSSATNPSATIHPQTNPQQFIRNSPQLSATIRKQSNRNNSLQQSIHPQQSATN